MNILWPLDTSNSPLTLIQILPASSATKKNLRFGISSKLVLVVETSGPLGAALTWMRFAANDEEAVNRAAIQPAIIRITVLFFIFSILLPFISFDEFGEFIKVLKR